MGQGSASGNPAEFRFAGGSAGDWSVTRMSAYRGANLDPVKRVAVVQGGGSLPASYRWMLRGVTSNTRYATAAEVATLRARQPALGRPEATHAALIPIRKSAAWWALAQDERRAIFEETSHHTAIGLDYLPAIARRLHHSRDLGEPFDFLTWFEFAPKNEAKFDDLLVRLRATKEWTFVEREVDIRLERG
jgi:chlorite dismutase